MLVGAENRVVRLFKIKNSIVFVLDLRIVKVKTCTGTTYDALRRLIPVGTAPHRALKKTSNSRFIMRNIRLFVKLFVISPLFLKKVFLSILNVVDDRFVL